jgi:hypothetical protein
MFVNIKLVSGNIIPLEICDVNTDDNVDDNIIKNIKDVLHTILPTNPRESFFIFKFEDIYCLFIKDFYKVTIEKKDCLAKDNRGNTYIKFDFVIEGLNSQVSFYEKVSYTTDENEKYLLSDDVKVLAFNENFEIISRKNLCYNREYLFQKLVSKFPQEILVL